MSSAVTPTGPDKPTESSIRRSDSPGHTRQNNLRSTEKLTRAGSTTETRSTVRGLLPLNACKLIREGLGGLSDSGFCTGSGTTFSPLRSKYQLKLKNAVRFGNHRSDTVIGYLSSKSPMSDAK